MNIYNNSLKQIDLKEKLQKIYYGTINIDTVCDKKCECCKISCPSMYYSEFCQIVHEVWNESNKSEKIKIICKSIEYFMYNEFEKFGMDALIKPCLLLSKNNKCRHYKSRPLNCRMYGLWSIDAYSARVDKFEKAYADLGLKREDLPLNKQCPYVKRVDESIPLTDEIINGLYKQLDELDKKVGNFTDTQIQNKENYRTFSDFLLLKVFGEEWLIKLTDFVMAADKNTMIDLIEQIIKSVREQFAKNMPDIRGK